MRRFRSIAVNVALLAVSTVIAMIACEFVARFFMDPVDYLKPPLVADEVLGRRIEPGAGGHDEWGYRNKKVPESSEIVAIGDSQTYGIGATSTDSWPAALEKITGRGTYNLSLGGYGPVHYLRLLEDKALGLSPSLVIVGLYYGNDIREAFGITYHSDYWQSLRIPEMQAWIDSIHVAETQGVTRRPVEAPRQSRAAGVVLAVREWMAGHSVVYRALFEFSPLGRILRMSQTRFAPDGSIIILDDPNSGIRTAFALTHRLKAIDLSEASVQEGMRITQEVFRRMHDVTTSRDIEFVVAIIPSKPLVYAGYLEHNETLGHDELIGGILANERRINEVMKASFDEYGIRYVDTLAPLQAAVAGDPLYPPNANSHPNRNGYAIIARAIQQFIATD